jgi:citrate lyase beta subunit
MTRNDLSAMIRDLQARHRAGGEMVRGLHVPYYRRGEMSIPAFTMPPGGDPETDGRAASMRLMEKARTLHVDLFFFDCEDAAPDHPTFKAYARRFAADALTTYDFGDRIVGFRPNNIRTEYFEDDIVEVLTRAGDRIQVMIIPKVESAAEVRDTIAVVRDVCRHAGHTNSIFFEVLIESPRAFLEAREIAAIEGVTALILGSFDFARAIGGLVDAGSWQQDQLTIRQMLPVIAAAAGKEAVDAITAELPIRPPRPGGMAEAEYRRALATGTVPESAGKLPGEFLAALGRRNHAIERARQESATARRCGYAARWILHPDQIGPVQQAWTPDRSTALKALDLIAGYARAALAGSGVELTGNRLADKAVVATEWWHVRAALHDAIITGDDIRSTGLTLAELERSVRTR